MVGNRIGVRVKGVKDAGLFTSLAGEIRDFIKENG